MKQTTRTLFTALALGSASLSIAAPALAHCEIPCGIYDDEAKFDELDLDVKTIKRSIEGIAESKSMHDTARWVTNKENHAQKIQDAMAVYFLAQRIKAPASDAEAKDFENYATSLKLSHEIIVAAMKTKQTSDQATADALQAAVTAYREHYFALHGHKH